MTTAIAPAQAAAPAKTYTVRDLLRDKQAEIVAALPRHIPPAHFMRVVLTAVQRNPQLAQCTSISFFGAVLQCAQLGLVPDGFLGQAYLIPYKNNKRSPAVYEVQFQAGYRGLVTLARRSGEVTSIGAEVVYTRDQFKHTRGITTTIDHKPFEGDEDPGALTHVYAWYRLRGSTEPDVLVMNRREVHRIRDRSQAYRAGIQYGRKDSPWFTDEAWMWKKTSLKQHLKLAPMSVELQRAASLDDVSEAGLPQDLHLLADPTAEPTALLDGENGEDELDPIDLPQRTAEPAAAAPAPAAAAPADQQLPTPNLPSNGAAPLVDRIAQTAVQGNAWQAITQGGLKLWTRDPALGAQLIAASGALRQIHADQPDAQGRRKLLGLAV